jgi:hypothetical protein
MLKPKPLDEVRNVARLKHLSRSTERADVNYIRRFILFHHKRHPLEMGAFATAYSCKAGDLMVCPTSVARFGSDY